MFPDEFNFCSSSDQTLKGISCLTVKLNDMNGFFKTLIAGYGAKKLGGGCLSTIAIFVVIYMLLGQCN